MNSGKVFLGVLAGIAAGAVLGILFAPDEGKNTRKKMVNKSKRYSDDLKSKFDKFHDSLTEKFDGTMEDADVLMSKGKAKYDETKKDVKNAIA